MESRIYGTIVMFFLATTCLFAEEKSSAELAAVTEAYKAARDNLVSGSGTGVYEVYTARAGKGTKMELRAKAKTNISFDHGKFHIRLDYEKDEINHLESLVIVYDGTAILVNRISKLIKPSNSEGQVYEGNPKRSVMRRVGFDYNPCSLPAEILIVDKLPKIATALNINPNANMDYVGVFDRTPVIRCGFIASSKVGYNVVSFGAYNINHNNFQHENIQAVWEREKDLWYVKSIDRQVLFLSGRGDRTVLRYTSFEPNVEVSPSLFKFDSLELSPKARLIDRRPNAEERVLRQSISTKVDAAELDTLADTVRSLSLSSTPKPPPSKLVRYILLALGVLSCLLGLSLLWRRRVRARNNAPGG